MNIEFLMAARQRIVYGGKRTLFGALMDRPDDDPLVVTYEEAAKSYRGGTSKSPADAIELMVAERVDKGDTLLVTNPEGYAAARWLAQADLSALPDPIPRAFVLYLAAAYHEAGKYPTLSAALKDILANRTFA